MPTQHTFCRICEVQCGLIVETDDRGDVKKITPNTEHIASKGYACIKGLSANEYRDSPDRITQPLKRINGKLTPVSWEQALSEIGSKLRRLKDEYSGDSIGLYIGNPISMSFIPPILSHVFLKTFGSYKLYHTGSQDCNNKFVVAERMYGAAQIQPIPDIDNTEFFIGVGSNPVISKMSFLGFSHSSKRFKKVIDKGGRVIWLNPRKTETAKQVGEHQFIRPNTDVFFYLSFLHQLIKIGGIDEQRINEYMTGWHTVKAIAAGWPPARTEPVTGIPEALFCEWVEAYSNAKGACLYCSTGVNQGQHGSLAFWLQEVINAVSGNLDSKGGTIVGRGIVDVTKHTKFDPQKEIKLFRNGQTQLVMDTVPAGVLADDILDEGEGQLKGLIVCGGNPVFTCANSNRLEKAFKKLDLLVTIDVELSATSALADYVLPGSHWLERSDFTFAFNSMMGTSSIPYHHYTDPVLPLKGDARLETSIYLDICKYAGLPLGGSRILQSFFSLGAFLKKIPALKDKLPRHDVFIHALLNRIAGFGSLEKMRQNSNGVSKDEIVPGDFLGKRLVTPDKKVNLAPQDLVSQSGRFEKAFNDELANTGKLKLISKRERFSHNSWTQNNEKLAKSSGQRNSLQMNTEDASARGIEGNREVIVFTEVGEIRVHVNVTDDMMAGTLALCHGWGHQHAVKEGLTVAGTTLGANVNVLIPDGTENMEPISGMSQLNGIYVNVKTA